MSADADEPEIDELGLLEGLHGPARRERTELIAWLVDRGFDVERIRSAMIPMRLPASRLFGDDGTLVSAREISEANGLDVALLQRLHRAAGMVRVEDPDKVVLARADAESVLAAARLIDVGLDPSQVTLIVRLLMEGLSATAMTMRHAAMGALLHPGATELELAQALEAMAQQVQPLVGPMVDALMRLALRNYLDTEAINIFERTTGKLPGARDVAVAFADLVGFTQLGEELAPEELGLIAGRLAELAREVVTSPVQFVKTIGDAVMLVSTDPLKLLITVLDLVEYAADGNFPRLRVGIAFGSAVSRSGDWYGSPVNLASRVTSAAAPGTVRVAESARTAIGDAPPVEWTFVEARLLKGIRGEVRLYDARRADQ